MYAFGDFVLDVQLFQLRCRGRTIPLEPKVFDVLRYLVEHRQRVATKQELLGALWPGEAVTDAVLPTNINALRRALGQKRGDKLPIETVHGRGYRFAAQVQEHRGPDVAAPPPVEPPRVVLESSAGRRPLMHKLGGLLELALAGWGQIVVLTGEAGIGKTFVAQRVAQSARAAGAEVWTASSAGTGEGASLWMFRQLLQDAFARQPQSSFAAEEHALLAPALGVSDEQAALRMYDVLLRQLTRPARPCVVWLEDMHCADELSWQLVRMLAVHLARASVLVLITLRSSADLTAVLPVQKNLELLQRTPHCNRLLVRALDLPQVRALAEERLGEPVEAALATALHDKSGGNPLFVRELVDWLEVRGTRDPSALKAGPHTSPPELVRQLLRRRVSRLGSEAKRLLEVASVVGMSWDAELVARVTLLAPEPFADALDAALAHGVITAVEGRIDDYRFAHDLLRETLYGDLSQRERRRLHGSIASTLEERVVRQGLDGVRSVAQHFYQSLPGGDVQRALGWLERAASLCEQQASYREAARLYRQALDAARLLPVADPALARALGEREAWLSGMVRGAPAQS